LYTESENGGGDGARRVRNPGFILGRTAGGVLGCGGQGRLRRLPERRFEFVPLWESPCSSCMPCGVSSVRAVGNSGTGAWARGSATDDELPLVSRRLGDNALSCTKWWRASSTVTWPNVFESGKTSVIWASCMRTLGSIEAIGVTRFSGSRGHHYLTLVYQIDNVSSDCCWSPKTERR